MVDLTVPPLTYRTQITKGQGPDPEFLTWFNTRVLPAIKRGTDGGGTPTPLPISAPNFAVSLDDFRHVAWSDNQVRDNRFLQWSDGFDPFTGLTWPDGKLIGLSRRDPYVNGNHYWPVILTTSAFDSSISADDCMAYATFTADPYGWAYSMADPKLVIRAVVQNLSSVDAASPVFKFGVAVRAEGLFSGSGNGWIPCTPHASVYTNAPAAFVDTDISQDSDPICTMHMVDLSATPYVFPGTHFTYDWVPDGFIDGGGRVTKVLIAFELAETGGVSVVYGQVERVSAFTVEAADVGT